MFVERCSTFLASKASHKDMGDSKSTLLRLYYHHRFFMGYCAIGAEVSTFLLIKSYRYTPSIMPFRVLYHLAMYQFRFKALQIFYHCSIL